MAVGIEHSYVFFQAVALLTECVDRNLCTQLKERLRKMVALLTECVDRNFVFDDSSFFDSCRTPYGVRG